MTTRDSTQNRLTKNRITIALTSQLIVEQPPPLASASLKTLSQQRSQLTKLPGDKARFLEQNGVKSSGLDRDGAVN
ncbi:hypothetical protein QLX08_007096 [Tetragonisca angustula]|uniref:Uncharacterized protein n=1 Tax=Tetragonisca angustula TaxID=166442 RepID=A0AAW0ZTT6_9HYME